MTILYISDYLWFSSVGKYLLVANMMTKDKGEEMCQKIFNGYLAQIGNAQEASIVADYLTGLENKKTVWIGKIVCVCVCNNKDTL